MKKILIVEDSVLIQKIIQDALEESFPCEVKAVDDGGKAWEEVSSNPYDLVILDIVMPVMDGLTLTEKIRLDLASDVPIVMLTSLGVQNVRESASASGVNAYLTKPIDTENLIRVVERLTASKTPREDPEPPRTDVPPAATGVAPEVDEDSLPEIEEWTAKIDEDW